MINIKSGTFVILAAGLFFASALTSCSRTEKQGDSDAPRIIHAAHTQGYVPYGYLNDRGESDGFEIAVLRAVDELLPEYEFRFTATSDEDLLIGLETGKYKLATKGAWLTEERKQKYIFPKHPVAASIIGLTFRSSDEDKISNLESFAEYSGKLVPISPQSAQYSIIRDYNSQNPDKQITLVPSDTFIINDAYIWVLEGRYDGFLDIKLSFQNNVLHPDGANHVLADRLTWVPYKGIPTWPLFARGEQELADAYDRAMEILHTDGTITSLSEQYFQEDVFQYISD